MIVVYDAHCLLCSGSIQFLLRHDRQGALRFASMQGETGRRLLAQAGVNPNDVDTVLFVRDGQGMAGKRRRPAHPACARLAVAVGMDRLVDPGKTARRRLPPHRTQPLSMVWAVRHLHPAAAGHGTAVS